MKLKSIPCLIVSIAAGFLAGTSVTLAAPLETRLSKRKLTLEIGETCLLKRNKTPAAIQWKTSNKTIVAVSSKGTITALAEGTAKLMADINGKKYIYFITVKKPQSSNTKPITKILEKQSEHTSLETEKESSDVPADYALYGITIDKETKGWIYCGKKIAALYDPMGYIFNDDSLSEEEAVYLEVLRSSDGKVNSLKEITKDAMEKIYYNW